MDSVSLECQKAFGAETARIETPPALVDGNAACTNAAAVLDSQAGAAIVLICAVYGGVIELLQASFTATRGAEWLDELANISGASLAALGWQVLCAVALQKR